MAEQHGESLLSAMINTPSFCHANYFWESELLIEDLPLVLLNIISNARNFAQSMHGAVLLYNLMLAQAQKKQELADDYINDIEKWASGIAERKSDLLKWHSNLKKFWDCDGLKLANIPYLTKQFVETWCSIVYQLSEPKSITENDQARELVRLRELRLKKNRARLQNSRYLELWNGSSGAAMLDYRWRQASTIILDIRKGLGLET